MHYREIKTSHLTLLVIGVILSAAMLFMAHSATVNSLTGSDPAPSTACTGTFDLKIFDQSSTVLSSFLPPDKVYVRLVSPSPDVSAVTFRVNGNLIGRAYKDTSGTAWTMPWLTTLFPTTSTSQTLMLRADVYSSSGSGNCFVSSPYTYVKDITPQRTILVNTDAAGGWTGALPVNTTESINSSVIVDGYPLDPTPFTLFEWKVISDTNNNIGYVTSQNNVGKFTALNEGTGRIVLEAVYGGDRESIEIPVSVGPASAPLPDLKTTTTSPTTNTTNTTNTTTSTSSPTSDTTTTTSPTVTTSVSSDSGDADAALETQEGTTSTQTIQNTVANRECLRQILTSERYDQINSGQSRPTYQEIEKLKACFASSNYIIPNNFSPVDPLRVKDLPKTKKVEIAKLENVAPTRESDVDLALKITGKADPNSTVLIYVFSDPLVLTTTADSYGNWEYTLEDPLEPGDHEVYTVVDRGNGVYERSAPVSFVIATAQAEAGSGANPEGLSLRLADAPTPGEVDKSLWFYLVGAGGVLIITIATFLIVLNYRHHRKMSASGGLKTEASMISSGSSTTNSASAITDSGTVSEAPDDTADTAKIMAPHLSDPDSSGSAQVSQSSEQGTLETGQNKEPTQVSGASDNAETSETTNIGALPGIGEIDATAPSGQSAGNVIAPKDVPRPQDQSKANE